MALLGDGFPWWKVKNGKSDSLLHNFECGMKFPSVGCFIYMYDNYSYEA